MGTVNINGHTYKTIEKSAPKMTKKQMEHYTAQVGQFGSKKTTKKPAGMSKRGK